MRDARPLAGRRVLVTRPREQAGALVRRLRQLGAEPVECPTIAVEPPADWAPLDAALARLHEYAWVVFTSANGVRFVFDRLAALGRDARTFAGVRIAAIGPATAAALRSRGATVDWSPDRFLTEAIVAGFEQLDLRGARVLLPRTDIAPPELADRLTALGARVEQVVAYRTVPAPADALRRVLAEQRVDAVTLTSASTAEHLVAALGDRRDLLAGALVACIGPVTADAARRAGLRVDAVAEEHTTEGLVQALVAALSPPSIHAKP